MRESIGGSMMMYIVLIFMTIFIILLASITRYGRVFRIKNTMINYLEQNEGVSQSNGLTEFNDKLRSLGYGNVTDESWTLCRKDIDSRNATYYYLTLYMDFELPLSLPSIRIAVKGDTKLIESGVHFSDSSGIFGSVDQATGLSCYTGNTFTNE